MFENKVAVVTGAGGTLCSAIAIDLAEKGARVVLVGRTKEKLEKTLEKIENKKNVLLYPCDVTDEKSVEALAAATKEALGNCDFLINGAGGNNIKAMPTITKFDEKELTGQLPEGERGIYTIDMDAFKGVIELNTMGTVLPTLAFGKQMIENGGGVLFIPSHLVEEVVGGAAKTQVKDLFGFEMITLNKFTTAQIDKNTWTKDMLDLLMEFIEADDRAAEYRGLDWSHEYDLAINGDPNDTQSAL